MTDQIAGFILLLLQKFQEKGLLRSFSIACAPAASFQSNLLSDLLSYTRREWVRVVGLRGCAEGVPGGSNRRSWISNPAQCSVSLRRPPTPATPLPLRLSEKPALVPLFQLQPMQTRQSLVDLARPTGSPFGASPSYSIAASTSPAATVAPSRAVSETTRPAFGAFISFCIFIASITNRPWPAATISPSATSRRTILPGMAAVTFRRPSTPCLPVWRDQRRGPERPGRSGATERTGDGLDADRSGGGFHHLDWRPELWDLEHGGASRTLPSGYAHAPDPSPGGQADPGQTHVQRRGSAHPVVAQP